MDPGATDRLHSARVTVAQRRDLARWISDGVAAGEVQSDVDPESEAASILSSMIGIIFQVLMDPETSAAKLCRKLKGDIANRLAVPAGRRPVRVNAAPAVRASRS
jgi:hypothetical protein